MSRSHVLMALVLSPLLLAACAGPRGPVGPASSIGSAAEPARPVARGARLPEQYCLHSGTRVPLAEGKCAPVRGSVVTREELDRTGEIGAGEALRRLVPL